MKCELYSGFMMKYFDGDLNDIQSAQLKQHLKSCKKCGEEFNSLSEVFNILETECIIEPPEDFEARVMEKLNLLETESKERTGRGLVFLYNFATAFSIILLIAFVANLKDISAFEFISRAGEYLGSFTSFFSALTGILSDVYNFAAEIFGVLFQVGITLVKNYYYVFITLLAMLLAVQKVFFVLVEQDRRGTK